MAVSCTKTNNYSTEIINADWTFALGDFENAQNANFDDSQWQKIGLPHSFAIPYFMSRDFYTGYGWYRKRINLTGNDLKNRILLEFDGVFQEAEIFVNGKPSGSHTGGYTGFSIDITENAVAGENIVAVRVNNIWNPKVAPRAGEHNFNGGIYRTVRLAKKNPTHIAWCGLQITTPGLKETEGKSAAVNTDVTIENQANADKTATLKLIVKDGKGAIVAQSDKELKIKAGERLTANIATAEIATPMLWSVDSPMLYTAECQIVDGDKVIDSQSSVFGFRWLNWTADHGFFLNGKHLYLRGANVHQDHAGWCDAITEEAVRRDVRMIKEAGFNMIRGSHYPHSPAFADECSRQGILFWSEMAFWGTGGNQQDGYWYASAYPVNNEDTAAFEQSVLQQLEEMIVINRNQPSIFAWSMCNEVFFTQRQTIAATKNLLRKMVERTHQLDTTRFAAIGGAQRPLGADRFDLLGDAVGYNGDGATIPDFIRPGIPSLVSEYSTTTAIRPGVYDPGWADLQKDDAYKGVEWRGGQCIWCGFDHGSIFGSQLGKTGIIDYFRIPKRAYYWYRNEYAGIAPPEWPTEGEPAALKIESTKTKGILTDGTDDVRLIVSVLDASGRLISNSPDVRLRIVSGPGEFPTGREICFSKNSDIQILDGLCAIEMRAYQSGKIVVEATSDGLTSGTIELEFVGGERFVEGKTPVVADRPYIQKRKARTDDDIQILGTNNPTFARSNAPGHSAGMAADGDEQTFWQPAPTDKAPQWVLDTERGITLKRVEVTLGGATDDVTVSISNDGGYYIQLAHYDRAPQKIIIEHNDLTMRFLKLNFGSPENAKIIEAKVFGWLED
ncbi:MAG: beta-galactosidase [Salinivirgaceae bacterium]|nr:beta-galactosidase [Salinivirgaceae bacterium]